MGKKLANKVAIITGSGSGMGAEMATLFAAEGASIVGADINIERANEVAEKIKTMVVKQ